MSVVLGKAIGLVSKNKYGVYKIRFRVSKQLQEYFKRSEINKSLETRDIKEAQLKATIIKSKYLEIVKVVSLLSKDKIQDIVDNFIIDTLEQDKIDRIDYKSNTAEEYLFAYDELLRELTEQLAENKCSSFNENRYKSVLDESGISYDVSDVSYKLFIQHMMRSDIEITKEIMNRYEGNYNKKYDFNSSSLPTKKSSQEVSEPKVFTYKEAVEKYLILYNYTSNSNGTSNEQIQIINNFFNNIFLPLITPEDDITKTTLEDIIELRETFLRLPKGNIQKYRVMPILQRTYEEIADNELLCESTVNTKYMRWLKAFYTYMFDQGIINNNFVRSIVSSNQNSALDERLPLEDSEIVKLLELTQKDTVLNNMIKILYTSGMRLSEVYKCKINDVDGVKVYDLTDRTVKLKTKSSYRKIPVHISVDVSLIDSLPTQDTVSKKVNSLIREHISEDYRKVLYSLRHSFATKLKNKRVDDTIISELMGHTHQGMSLGRYAGAYKIQILKEAIEKLDY